MKRSAFTLLCLFSLAGILIQTAVHAAGIIQAAEGEALLIRAGTAMEARRDMVVEVGDRLKTGAYGRIGIVFDDDTIVSIGPESDFVVEDFRFEPRERKLSFVSRLIRGVMSFISGKIGKLAGENVRIETPQATVGLRGTRVLITDVHPKAKSTCSR